ncbi:MAG TPA: sigma-70 family RNA polymerase sigma factor [Gemmata sp.]|nr:sigma-70 family RNA polymerase sigma factor [Gemmata sp.]
MTDDQADDRDLVAKFKAGSESAATELFTRYCEKLMSLARRRIGQRMASRIDPEDAIQSAFRTFFARVRNDQFTFEGESDLFKLLVKLTVNKTLRQIAHHRAAKRDPGKEAGGGATADDIFHHLAAGEPTPDVEVALLEQFEHFLSQFSAFDRKVLEMKLQGNTTAEIAAALETYERKVRRVMERAAELLKEDAGEDEASAAVPA